MLRVTLDILTLHTRSTPCYGIWNWEFPDPKIRSIAVFWPEKVRNGQELLKYEPIRCVFVYAWAKLRVLLEEWTGVAQIRANQMCFCLRMSEIASVAWGMDRSCSNMSQPDVFLSTHEWICECCLTNGQELLKYEPTRHVFVYAWVKLRVLLEEWTGVDQIWVNQMCFCLRMSEIVSVAWGMDRSCSNMSQPDVFLSTHEWNCECCLRNGQELIKYELIRCVFFYAWVKSWVFARDLNFLIPISLQPDGVFISKCVLNEKLEISWETEINERLKYAIFSTLGLVDHILIKYFISFSIVKLKQEVLSMAAMIHVDKIYHAVPVLVWLGVLDLTSSLYYLFFEKKT